VKKFLRYTAGIGLVLLGIIGIILPLMPGLPFLIPGLTILAEEVPWLDRILKKWIAWAKEKMMKEKRDAL
jgi:uncharacterized membrane protein YbaN (DUF454 family)